jgi:hypothetical protein
MDGKSRFDSALDLLSALLPAAPRQTKRRASTPIKPLQFGGGAPSCCIAKRPSSGAVGAGKLRTVRKP